MYKCLLLFVLCDVLAAVSHRKNDCPTLVTCTCDKVKGRAKCWNMMEVPVVTPEIEILELTNNAIIEVKRSDFKHHTLTDLFLGNNKIRVIDKDAFQDLSDLTLLNLSNNQLRVLDKQIFKKNKKLKHLYLDNNPNLQFSLSELPDTIEQLNVANTNITITSNIIRNLSNLHSYYGNFCLKRNCSHSIELKVVFSKDDTSSRTADTEPTTEDSSPVVKESKMTKEINPDLSLCLIDRLLLIGTGLLIIGVQITGFIVLYRMLKSKKPEMNEEKQTLTDHASSID